MLDQSSIPVTARAGRSRGLHLTARSSILLALIAALYVAARLWRITSYGIYGDETFSLWVARQDWWGAIVGASEDVVHPPLFYLLLKAWIAAGGESVVWLKLFPVMTSIISIIPFLLLCRELRLDAATASLALGLMAVNCYSVIYAQDLRMYSLVSLLAICSLWLFAREFNSGKSGRAAALALLAVNLLLVYTHYYGWLLVGIELICFLIWRRPAAVRFSLSVAVLIACFIPWVYMVAQAAIAKGGLESNIGWNLRPGISDVVWFYMNLCGPISYRWDVYGWLYPVLLVIYPVLVVLFFRPVAIWMRQAFKSVRASQESQPALFGVLFLFSFLPVLISVIASYVLPYSVWGIRYLIISAPAFFILVAASVLRMTGSRLKTATLSGLIVWSALAGFTELNHRDRLVIGPIVRQMIEAEASRDGEIIIYSDDGNVRNTVQYYIESGGETRFQTVYTRDVAEMKGDHFWVASLRYRYDHTPSLQSSLAAMGYEVGDGYETASSGHKVFLFPVRNRSGSTSH
ncbi:MAG TPA: hypothetical protein VNO14_02810 [Blastocatellia bacterium]|nr:hypothetical protein [Blastocatellia bacterium]